MKKFNFVTGILVASAALMAAGCASDSSSGTTPTNTISVANAPAPTGGTGGGGTIVVTPTPPPSNSGSRGGCGAIGSSNRTSYAYTGSVTAVGPVTSGSIGVAGAPVSMTSQIATDGTLRVSVRPSASGSNTTTGGSQPYTKMSMTVILKQNGVEVARRQLPTNPLDNNGYNAGIATGALSDPLSADFSAGSLQGSGYSIEIANVKTDYICRTNMTVAAWNSQVGRTNDFSGAYCNYGYQNWNWAFDYNTSAWYCMYQGSLFTSNQHNVCGVGVPTATSRWSADVQVETDKTYCIQN